jgi:acyl-CoA oxidase
MPPPPEWVKALKPSGPQGSELIAAEREKSNISVDRLSNFLFTKEVLDRQQRILDILKAEKVFDKSNNYFDGRVDKFKTALARAKRLRQLQVKHNWTRDEYHVANELISEPGPYGLHASMYLVSRFLSCTGWRRSWQSATTF